MSLISPDLLKRFITGDRDAFERIYIEYAPKVHRFARRYMNNDSDAEEIVQNLFIKIWDSRVSIDPSKNFDKYVFTITKNMVFSNYRHKVNETYLRTIMLASLERDCYIQEDEIHTEDLSRYIDAIVENLPAKQREVFTLSRKGLLSYKEIAIRMNISEKTVGVHIYHTLTLIRDYIKRRG